MTLTLREVDVSVVVDVEVVDVVVVLLVDAVVKRSVVVSSSLS